jgi:hypothetical protein
MNTLLQDIEAFLETHSATLSATAFGELAMNDRHLVRQMRGDGGRPPRRIWPETEAKIRRFMATYKPEQEAA